MCQVITFNVCFQDFMLVQGIEQLYSFVKKSGWNQITEVTAEPWGGKTCQVTTIDGSVLKFFEL
jgi:AraC family transcriptional regulator